MQIKVEKQLQADGSVTIQPRTDVSAQAYAPNAYSQPQLIPFRADGTVVRSWNSFG